MDLRSWSTFGVTRCTRESRGRRASVRLRMHQSRMVKKTDKGRPEAPNIRARWVAKDFKTEARPELYAPTPPLEALRMGKRSCGTCPRAKGVLLRTVAQESICRITTRGPAWHNRCRAELGGGACFDTQQPQDDERNRVSFMRMLWTPCMAMTLRLEGNDRQ